MEARYGLRITHHDGKKGATLTFSIPLSKLKEAKLRLRKSNDE